MAERSIVLFSKDFSRCHKGCLKTVCNSCKQRIYSYCRLAGTDIPLQQSVHRPLTAHVLVNFTDYFLLAFGKLEWKEFIDVIFNIFTYTEFIPAHFLNAALTKCHCRLKEKELLILETSLRLFQAVYGIGKVNIFNCIGGWHKLMFTYNIIRKYLFNLVKVFINNRLNQFTKTDLSHLLRQWIYRQYTRALSRTVFP